MTVGKRLYVGLGPVLAIPVIVTALLFLSSAIVPVEALSEKYQLVFQLNPLTFFIDEVREVLDIPEASIEDAPAFGASIDTEFILGMGKIGATVKILLDIAEAAHIPVSKAPLENMGERLRTERLDPVLRTPQPHTADHQKASVWISILERLNFNMDIEREALAWGKAAE